MNDQTGKREWHTRAITTDDDGKKYKIRKSAEMQGSLKLLLRFDGWTKQNRQIV